MSLPGYTYESALKYTDIKLRTPHQNDLVLTITNNIRGGLCGVIGDRYVVSDDNKKILYKVVKNLYGHSISQFLFYDEIEMWHCHPDLFMIKLEETLYTPDDSDSGTFTSVDIN